MITKIGIEWREIFSHLGCSVLSLQAPNPRLYLSQEEQKAALDLLQAHGLRTETGGAEPCVNYVATRGEILV